MYYPIMDEGNVGHTDLVSPWTPYIFYEVLIVGETDPFNTLCDGNFYKELSA